MRTCVRGLVWRSHVDWMSFSAAENRALDDEIEHGGGEVILDQRVRRGGSHHQKLVVLRHDQDPTQDVAFVGGIDLCHGRRDDAAHRGDRDPRDPAAGEAGTSGMRYAGPGRHRRSRPPATAAPAAAWCCGTPTAR